MFSIINGKEYSHSRVYKISGDRFYALLSGDKMSFYKLYKALPKAIDDFLKNVGQDNKGDEFILKDISKSANRKGRSIIDEITFTNFYYYSGFETIRQG